MIGQGVKALNCKRVDLDKEQILYYEGGEAQAQVDQRSSRCPIPRHVQGQVVWGSGKPGLVEGVPPIQGSWSFNVPSDPNNSVIL